MSTTPETTDQPAAASLHDNAINVLLCIHNQENEEASTSDIRAATGLSAANISGHHALTLIEEGLIEKAGSEESDNAPRDPNVYTLTHRGRKQANLLLKQRAAPMSDEEKTLLLRHLQDRVDELEQQVENGAPTDNTSGEVDQELAEQVDKNTEMIEDHESKMTLFLKIVKQIRKELD